MLNILIVDDLLNNRKLLRDMLKSYGQCDMVGDGAEGVEMFEGGVLEGNPYDLVLLDIMMPGMNGQEALGEMRRVEREQGVSKQAVIIMVTAVDSPQNVLKAFYQGGCHDYIVKPFKQNDLLDKLRSFHLI